MAAAGGAASSGSVANQRSRSMGMTWSPGRGAGRAGAGWQHTGDVVLAQVERAHPGVVWTNVLQDAPGPWDWMLSMYTRRGALSRMTLQCLACINVQKWPLLLLIVLVWPTHSARGSSMRSRFDHLLVVSCGCLLATIWLGWCVACPPVRMSAHGIMQCWRTHGPQAGKVAALIAWFSFSGRSSCLHETARVHHSQVLAISS